MVIWRVVIETSVETATLDLQEALGRAEGLCSSMMRPAHLVSVEAMSQSDVTQSAVHSAVITGDPPCLSSS